MTCHPLAEVKGISPGTRGRPAFQRPVHGADRLATSVPDTNSSIKQTQQQDGRGTFIHCVSHVRTIRRRLPPDTTNRIGQLMKEPLGASLPGRLKVV